MRRSLLLFSLAAVALMAWRGLPEVVTESYTGYAYGEGKKNLLYTEVFTDRFMDGKHVETLTDYFDPDHRKIAQRKLDFRKSKFAPDFTTEDIRTGYMEGADRKGNQVRLFRRAHKDAAIEERVIDIPEPAVVDGGFNQLIKANWKALEDGESLTFQFAVPARLDYFTLRAVKVESNEKVMKVRVEPDKALLRWIATPIVISYDVPTKRIRSYEGKSNISDENGKNFMMKLEYPRKGP